MDINDRLKVLIEAVGLNNNLFAKQIGVNPTVTHNIISGRRTKPSSDLLEKILLSFDNINAEWLVCGKGSMWSDPTRHPTPDLPTDSSDSLRQTIEILRQQLEETQRANRDLLEAIKNLSAAAGKK